MINLHQLEGREKNGYITWGVPWKIGEVFENDSFVLKDKDGVEKYVQTKATAYWQDGSVKWTSHTAKIDSDKFFLKKGEGDRNKKNEISENDSEIIVDNGMFKAVFKKSGKTLMSTPFGDVMLKVLKEKRENDGDIYISKQIPFLGETDDCVIEDKGDLKTTVKVSGSHKYGSEEFLKFIVRFEIFNNCNEIKIMHTFLYDGDEKTDFIKGVGLVVKKKMHGGMYNRRIKIAGDFGIMHETMQLMNTWRPKIGMDIYKKQLAGEIQNLDETDDKIKMAVDNVTVWDSYRLEQKTPDSFIVKKRTVHECCTFIDSNWGKRSKGLVYIGDEDCGVALARRDFWQKASASIYAEGLSCEEALLTSWIVPPDCEALDMRHYDTVAHDQTYYEGFPEIGASAYGIASTNEMSMFVFYDVPDDKTLMKNAERVQKPPVVLCDVEYYHNVKAFGEWSMISRDTPLKKWLEDELDKAFEFYKNEIEQRHWYGLFNYGDVMHTYDAMRHCWKYDMGGYAWQNTELVPTLWLWYAFLRSGREDIFTVAEAMSRHAADVDLYHFGDLKGLGSRHNVVHWGDSCKEPRVAMAGHHRALYYLMGGDYRIGDVLDDVKDADFATLNMDPLRYFYKKEEMKMPTHARSGPDWSTYCSNWFTAWERRNDTSYRDKIQTGLDDFKKAPLRMISGSNFEYDPETGHLGYIGESAAGGSHLAVCMGGPQTYFELAECLEDDEFKDMLIQYGEFYFVPAEEKKKMTNGLIEGTGFVYPYMAASLCAYAAREKKNEKLAYQVWQVLVHSLAGKDKKDNFDKSVVENYFNSEKLDELFWISTNFTAQWCLNTIVALELTKDYLPESKEDLLWEDWVK